jgi:hypothetical protein
MPLLGRGEMGERGGFRVNLKHLVELWEGQPVVRG